VPESSPAPTAEPTADVPDPPGRDDGGYRELAEAIPLIAWRTDADRRILDANSRWAAYTGHIASRGDPLPAAPPLHPADISALNDRWSEAAARQRPVDARVRLMGNDGGYRWFHLRAVPTCDEDGLVTGWVGTCSAVDDSRSGEIDGTNHEADRFRLILDSVVEAIIVFDPDTQIIDEVNRGACQLLGRTRQDLIGTRFDSLLNAVEAARVPAIVGPLVTGEKAASTTILAYQRGDDRHPAAVEVVLQPVDFPGSARAIVAIARDVRDRIEVQVRLQRLAQAEHARAAELNAVIRAMGEAVVVCAADGAITLTNPAGERLFPDVDERTYADILEQLSDPEGVAPTLGTLHGPIEMRARADPDRWIEIATYPVSAGVGSPPSGETIVVMRDVTEARRREAVRETFIGVLSHELRTPVTTIFGGAKLLARSTSTLDEETQRGIFRDIHEEAERLQRLVEDVVALNRFGDEAGDVGAEPVLLQRLIPRVVGSEEGRWPGVSFAMDIAAGLPTVTADPTYVEQVLRNLLSNGAKYGGPGSTVTVAAEHGDNEVIVRVLDDGPGFPAEETNRLFELFYRSPGTAGAASGAGIGLFVCARLMSAMGGRIWASPRHEGGAEFGFALGELSE
jgi:PAS domain S-box-containing protein